MRAYLHALSDAHAPKPWLSVQTGPRAESLSVVPATSAWWAQRTAPSPVTAKTAGRGGLSVDLGRIALSSTCSRDALPIKLHQPAINIPYKRLMGSDDRRKAGGQLELPVERLVVAPLDGLISPNIAQPAEQVDDVEKADISKAQ